MVNPDDGLPVAEDVGEWSREKHERLKRYIDIARAARWKYVDPSRPAQYQGGATYIDVFCGPGRARLEKGEIVDGSPLVAFKAAAEGNAPFSELHLADLDSSYSAATVQRVTKAGGTAFGYVGDAKDTARAIVSKLNPHGLHFAFLDPFNLGNLSFDVIKTLSSLKRIDLLMHVSIQDMQRNVDRYTSDDSNAFDTFAPGWREVVDTKQNLTAIRAAVLAHWKSLVLGLGFLDARSELIRGNKNQRLYWLAFASRHKIASDFWEKIRNIHGQKDLGF